MTEPETDLPIRLWTPEPNDPMGLLAATRAIEEFEPDVIYTTGDPGNIATFAGVIPVRIPYSTYIPIEGEPIVHQGWRETLNFIDFFTCSQYGADVVKRDIGKDVPWVYHGVDRDVFTKPSDEERAAFRKRLGWDDKFVITCVAQNVRRKQIPRLMEAVAILKRQFKQRDIVLYLHTVPFQRHYLEGWNLPEIARGFDIHDEVVFNPLMADLNASIPERGDLDVPGLVDLLGASDLFVLPSQVEGFGLPIAEAMATGVPVMVTKYGAGWEVARHGMGVGIRPHDTEIHKSGTRYANVDQLDLAKEILRLKRNPAQLRRMSDAGVEASALFDWSAFEKMVAARVINAAETASQSVTQQEAHQAEEARSQDSLPADATEAVI